MNGSDVLIALERLSTTSCKATKLADLALFLDDPLFALVSRLTCDPFINFGIKAPQFSSCGYREISGTKDSVFELLKALRIRKLTGAMARSALIAAYAELTPASGEVLRRILSRNLGCGLGAASLNSIREDHVPIFGVMLASKFEDQLFAPNERYVAEPKKDGMRAICLIAHDRAQFVTRNGRPLIALDGLAREILSIVTESYKLAMLPAAYGDGFTPTLVLDGEVVSGKLAQTVSDVRQTTRCSNDAVFEVFDILPYARFASDAPVEIALAERRRVLEQLFAHAAPHKRLSLIQQETVSSVAECYECFNKWEKLGFEGAMIKGLDAFYCKDRSRAWLKLKRHETEDILVTASFEGTGRHTGILGGLICDFNGVSVRVGSGFSDRERRDLWRKRNQLQGRIVEVAFQEVTSTRSLRHPRFISFRDDKVAPE